MQQREGNGGAPAQHWGIRMLFRTPNPGDLAEGGGSVRMEESLTKVCFGGGLTWPLWFLLPQISSPYMKRISCSLRCLGWAEQHAIGGEQTQRTNLELARDLSHEGDMMPPLKTGAREVLERVAG